MEKLATQAHDLLIFVPSSFRNLNLSPSTPETGSSHTPQVPHVIGHAAETPAIRQRFFVFLVATQLQVLAFFKVPSMILSLKAESTQFNVLEADGDADGDFVGFFVGSFVGGPPVGDADGLGDGLIDVEG